MKRSATYPIRWPNATVGWLVGLLLLTLMLPASACRVPPGEASSASPEVAAAPAAAPVASDSAFARLVEQLSEPGGYFDTDNLISNETSYAHVLSAMRKMGVQGGAYLGVGPDQNYAYIAQVRPNVAFVVDIRRDNVLQHLFFKALFSLARNRLDYLCLLFGKPAPGDLAAWDDRGIEHLLAYLDETPTQPDLADAIRARVGDRAAAGGLPLTAADRATIDEIHARFIRAGLDLRFASHNRPPRSYYPTYRKLLLEKDLTGRYGSYLAREDDFQFVKALHERDGIIPVVGDLAGPHAVAAIGRYLAEHGERVSVFYTSNVEYYLMGRGRFDRFAENVRQLPWDERGVLVRSYFNRFRETHPQTVPGYASTQLLQTAGSFIKEYERGGYRTYADLIHKHVVDLR